MTWGRQVLALCWHEQYCNGTTITADTWEIPFLHFHTQTCSASMLLSLTPAGCAMGVLFSALQGMLHQIGSPSPDAGGLAAKG